jgi:Carboxypeptidase regulatory-like domain
MRFTRSSRFLGLMVFAVVLFASACLFAGVTASISGTVTDASGAVVAGATVTATNVETAVATTLTTNAAGFYSFPELPLGKYTLDVSKTGFKAYRETELVLDVNSALSVNVALLVGQTSEKVEVTSSAIHVDTENTQMGEVITGKTMTDVPLVSRSYTDLLSLQPGVTQTSSGMNGASSGSFISAGFALPLVSGSLNAGAQSVNGMREAANGYILNGISVQETGYSGAGAVPNLDSISEFRIITNNFDAEYGNYSGGQINVVTKSGTNGLHGSGFEFLRNTVLDAADFFVNENGQSRGSYNQNQFGGTIGGPIKRDKIFFFADYQGNRLIQAVPQKISGAPSAATESGNFSAIASDFAGTTVGGPAWATQLSSQLGQPVTAGEPYYTPGCTTSAACVFPNAQLPATAFNPISTKILPYIQAANAGTIDPTSGTGSFSTDSGKVDLKDNKFSGRVDGNSRFGLLTAYYYWDKYNRIDPYWASNAPLYPGFDVDGNGLTQNINLGDTKTFSSAAVNEFRLGYFRLNQKFNQPLGGKETNALADLGFASGAGGAPGIYPGTPSVEGIPEIDFNSFVIGVPSRPNHIPENIYQIVDNFSKIVGTHSLKFGGQYHYNQLEENLSNVANGNFFFGSINGGSSETGSDFVDFLLGAPSSFVQGQSYPSYGRDFSMGLYAQDSWRAKSNLTINYGVRYDVSAPFKEKFNEIQTLIPGEQSVVFPGSPLGWLFPGDPGVPSTLAPTRWNNFAPRVGLAYSFGDHDGMLGKILGKQGTSSIRAGWGMFYTSFEGATDFNEIGDAPFGNYTGQYGTTFAAPFTNRASGNSITNLFPAPLPPRNFSASHPANQPPYDTLADFYSAFGGIGSSPAFYNKNRLPYAEDYELSLERQVTTSDLLTVSYVGTQGHRLLSSESANPGNPALCLQLTAIGATDLTNPGASCTAGGHENDIYVRPDGTYQLGTRTNFPGVALPAGTVQSNGQPVSGGITLPDGKIGIVPIGNDSYFITAGTSAYNSAQVEWRHTSGRSQSLFAYTYSKAMDDSSGYGEQINPINNRLSRGLSAFDSTHNFVASYSYQLPFDKLGGPKRLTNGWVVSGITKFSTGLPVTMVETANSDASDASLLGTSFGGPIILPVDTPQITGPLDISNPRSSANNQFFSPAAFGLPSIGTEGDSARRWFHGPGLNNWDFALLKNTALTERLNLQFRAELFNLFNHAQFTTPVGLTGSGSFGLATSDTGPRIGQLSLKLSF